MNKGLSPSLPLLFIAVAVSALNAQAATLVVTKTTDSADGVCDSDCSLREAVEFANSQPGTHRIQLPAGMYVLSIAPPLDGQIIVEEDANQNGDLDLHGDLTLIGAGKGLTFIDSGDLDRLLDVQPGAKLRLEHVGLRNGRTSGHGGALRNRGSATLNHVALTNNEVLVDVFSGAPTRESGGGAIANFSELSLSSSSFLRNGTFAGEPFGQGGALYNHQGARLQVRNSAFTANSSYTSSDLCYGGALYNAGYADVARSAFQNNSGGEFCHGSAILNADGGVMKLTNSTLTQNFGGFGAFANGLRNNPDNPDTQARLENVTIANNVGPSGLINYASLVLRNSIVAGNFEFEDEIEVSNCQNSPGSVYYLARGLMLGEDGYGCAADLPIDDAITFTQVLEPAAYNGGPTVNHALREGSPAIDAGVGSCTQRDQRKVARPQDGDGDGVAVCDLGAYEREAP